MTGDRAGERRAERRRVRRAAAISLLLHLLVILFVAWLFLAEHEPPPPPEEAEVEITFVEPPPPPEPPPVRFVDSTAPESAPVAGAAFESDRNTTAASPDAPTGEAPVPTQDGMDLPGVELEQRELALAEVAPAPPAPESPPVPPQPPEPPATPAPVAASEKPPSEEIKPESPLLAKAEPLPERTPEPTPPAQPAAPPNRPAFQRQTRPTRLSGSVSNRGKASVASLATPLGRYRKAVSDAIGSSWYHHIGPRMDMFSYGTVSVVFVVDRDGKAKRPRVISNTSNESFEIVTLESILSAEIPPIPPDIVATLEGGQIEIDYTFSIITN